MALAVFFGAVSISLGMALSGRNIGDGVGGGIASAGGLIGGGIASAGRSIGEGHAAAGMEHGRNLGKGVELAGSRFGERAVQASWAHNWVTWKPK